MKKHLLKAATAAAVAAGVALPLLIAGPASSNTPAERPAAASSSATTVYIVEVNDTEATKEAVTRRANEVIATNGGVLRRVYHSASQAFSVSLTPEQVTSYYKDTRVDSITSDRVYRVAGKQQAVRKLDAGATGVAALGGGVQTSPPSWGLDRVDQRDLPLNNTYRFSSTGAGVDAYIVDTGVRVGHQEFMGGRAQGVYDAIRQAPGGASDCNGHGTASAATAAGLWSGVAKGATVKSVRAFGCDGTGTLEHIMSAVDWITANADGPSVVNLGFSGEPGSVLDLQLYQMTNKGIAYTAAAGNGDSSGNGIESCETTPARQTTAITVAATDRSDRRPAWSNYGYCVHLFAPGTDITTAGALSNSSYVRLTGTSAATAEVTGAAALYLAAHPEATPVELDEALIAAATKDHVLNPGTDSRNLLLYTGPTGTTSGRADR
ncbi:S8 family peptidase [Streptomyces somaliensis DSM 40738]|uniref:S8 family peptidase n=1 Tax=Streptomyces somaliensis (strain ATCC 33201 / DSM 40738 / JCM 12659 / KCTC 9044 / NCTC 11332 / NRRL B-12077 / IP 733) TaxID=1134445 RepID=A0AA44IDY2_STRE0|nr:S8 family peptidase [Streptomyces somaliensis]MCQ0023206.1 S8 family peptidase [Streptomyces somaliensis DSM 40738]NKY15096.1 S8 family peptidase [Streptomyces somaliensis DSM 40738]